MGILVIGCTPITSEKMKLAVTSNVYKQSVGSAFANPAKGEIVATPVILAGSQSNPGVSCLEIGGVSGVYWIDPDGTGGNSAFQAYCDMTTSNGGWTLIFQRRGGANNVEACGDRLNAFLHNTCGSPSSLADSESYSMDIDFMPSHAEYLVFQKDQSNEAFIIGYSGNLFPSITGGRDTSVDYVRSLAGATYYYDNTEVYWRYSADNAFSSASCNGAYGSAGADNYWGNYGYCHNALGNYNANSLPGTRSGYSETKLWNCNWCFLGMERVFVR